MECFSYLLVHSTGNIQKTYIGATNNPDRRLKQHNGILQGGAKATKGKEWKRVVYVGGFPDWIATLQFEWAWKYHSRKKRGMEGKLEGLISLLQSDRSTKNALPFHLWPCKFFLCFGFFLVCVFFYYYKRTCKFRNLVG
jgi:predicted GIY-YIG superfamily endonuclease